MTATLDRPGKRGRAGRARGRDRLIVVPPTYRGSTRQVAGLNPFVVGSGAPIRGCPVGRVAAGGSNLGAPVGCDPITWFESAHLIHNPSMILFGIPGVGKSTWGIRQVIGAAARGVLPLVLGDLKPDYVNVIRALDGQVISLIPGETYLNVLDMGDAVTAAARLRAAGHDGAATELMTSAENRRRLNVESLITIERGDQPTDRERSVLSAALGYLDSTWRMARRRRAPILDDLVAVIRDAIKLELDLPDDADRAALAQARNHPIRKAALDRGDVSRYQQITENLEATLTALAAGRGVGRLFHKATTVVMRRDKPVVFDVSRIDLGDKRTRSAALMACWSYGFGQVAVSRAMSAPGIELEPQVNYLLVMDELWQVLGSGPGQVERADEMTRLNRREGIGTLYITHSMKDLLALPNEVDRIKARGFVERAGIIVLAGLPRDEMGPLRTVISMTDTEETMVSGWSTPTSWHNSAGGNDAPPGRGFYLIKVGGGTRTGIPVRMELTTYELSLGGSNTQWAKYQGASA